MAETLIITKSDLHSEMGKPSKLQRLLFDRYEKCNSIHQMSLESGLHHHTIKTLLVQNGPSRKLTRSTLLMLSSYLGLSQQEISSLRESV